MIITKLKNYITQIQNEKIYYDEIKEKKKQNKKWKIEKLK